MAAHVTSNYTPYTVIFTCIQTAKALGFLVYTCTSIPRLIYLYLYSYSYTSIWKYTLHDSSYLHLSIYKSRHKRRRATCFSSIAFGIWIHCCSSGWALYGLRLGTIWMGYTEYACCIWDLRGGGKKVFSRMRDSTCRVSGLAKIELSWYGCL